MICFGLISESFLQKKLGDTLRQESQRFERALKNTKDKAEEDRQTAAEEQVHTLVQYFEQ